VFSRNNGTTIQSGEEDLSQLSNTYVMGLQTEYNYGMQYLDYATDTWNEVGWPTTDYSTGRANGVSVVLSRQSLRPSDVATQKLAGSRELGQPSIDAWTPAWSGSRKHPEGIRWSPDCSI
jgi:hypothetical protein